MARILRENLVLVMLVTGLVLLTVGGMALLGTYVYLTGPILAAGGWQSPLDGVPASRIAPDLAVLSLAGERDERVIQAALDAEEIETAQATLAYSVSLGESVRGGRWIQIAVALRSSDKARSLAAYEVAWDLVALGPGLNDADRAYATLQIARGVDGLGELTLARLALTQAKDIAEHSLSLLPAERLKLLGQVAAGYQEAGDVPMAEQLRAAVAGASIGPAVRVEPTAPYLSALRGSIVLASGVSLAIQARQQSAADFATRYMTAGPSLRKSLAASLGSALLQEDVARTAQYSASSDLSAPDQLASLTDRIHWLTLKYRVAREGYGISLVSDWERQKDGIRTDLAAAYTDLINGYGRQLDTLAEPDALLGKVELLQQGLLWCRLGLFPDGAEQLLSGQLYESMRQLWTLRGGEGLVIGSIETNGRRTYFLSGGTEAPAPATPER